MALNRRVVDRIEKAVARASVSGEDTLVTVAAPAASDADPLHVALEGDRASMVFWQQPSLQFAVGAQGVAFEMEIPADATRFDVAAETLRDLRARTTQIAIDGAERTPLLLGGFSFFSDPEWAGFPSGRLVLPELSLIQRAEQSVWVAAASVGADTNADALAARLLSRVAGPSDPSPTRLASAVLDHERAVSVDLRDDSYLKIVADAVDRIQSTDLMKVVLARQLVVDHVPDLGVFLAALRARFETCATFAFGSERAVFCGTTPERLVLVEGVEVSTGAVAATAPRGADATQDEVIADRLRHDPKEIEEHGYVMTEIRRQLAASGCVLDDIAPTEVMRLPGIQHLYTPITATAPVGTSVLDVVGSLHPTPAVGGLPSEDALRWIAQREPLDRGWYAGPVGYCDLAGNGEFRVGLRSGLMEDHQSRLFVGAGVVGASSPERELEETSLKLGALLPSLLGS